MDEKQGWRSLAKGAVSIKSSKYYKTGDWGIEKPDFDLNRCTKCNLCYYFCPDGSISFGDDGYPTVNMFHCKGCGICAFECPSKSITMKSNK